VLFKTFTVLPYLHLLSSNQVLVFNVKLTDIESQKGAFYPQKLQLCGYSVDKNPPNLTLSRVLHCG